MKLNSKKLGGLFASSGIMSLSKKCYDSLLSGFFGSALTNYSQREETFENGIFGTDGANVGSWRSSRFSRFRRRAIVSYENSRIISALSGVRNMLLGFKLRFYGFFFIYFGICVLLMNLIKSFALSSESEVGIGWFIGALFAAAACPLLMSGKTLAASLGESLIFSGLIFGVFGFSASDLKSEAETEKGGGRYFAAALSGALLGCLTYFISPVIIFLGIAGLTVGSLIYKTPEIGILIAVLVAPFLSLVGSPSILLSLIIIYTFICMSIKIFLGKLIIKMELTDVFAAIFMLIMLMGGVISSGGGGSLKKAAMYTCLFFIYFMIVCLISNGDWLKRITGTLVTSGTLVALYGLYQKISGNLETDTIDKEVFEDISGRIASTFGVSNMLGVFLVMVMPFALAFVFSAEKPVTKLLSVASFAIMGVCLLYTWSRGAWLGFGISFILFIMLYSHYVLPLIIPGGLAGIALIWDKIGGSGLMNNLLSRFTSIASMSDTSSVYRLGIWRSSLGVIKENLFTGIGVGNEAFRTVYIRFAESGIEAVSHSHNLFFQILIETGIMGIIVFFAVIFLTVKSVLEVVRRVGSEAAFPRAAALAGMCGLVAACVHGMTDYIWFNYRIYFFFWTVCAIANAAARIGRRSILRKSEC